MMVTDGHSHWSRCDAETQKLVSSLTFEELITSQNGITISRALVNVVIDQQIGQQISVGYMINSANKHCLIQSSYSG